MSDGTLSIRRRRAEQTPEKKEVKSLNDEEEPTGYSFNQYLKRGSKTKPSEVSCHFSLHFYLSFRFSHFLKE